MNNRQEQMADFIEYLALISEKNQDIILNEKIVYGEMINFLVPQELKEISIYPLFIKWLNHFKTYNQIISFVDPNWNKYIQFYRNAYLLKPYCYKLTFSLTEIGFKSSAIIMLFDYLNQKDINFMAKVFYKIKSDSITIRIDNKEDVDKIMEYINNNPLIKDNLLLNNPFIVSSNRVGICYDFKLSYNLEVAILINNYINHLGKTLDYGNASFEGFSLYVNEISKTMMKNPEFIGEYKNNCLILNNIIVEDEEQLSLVELVKLGLKKGVIFNDVLNIKLNEKEITDLQIISYLEKATFDTYNNLGIAQTKIALYEYIVNNDCMGFTRENHCRLELLLNTNQYLAKQEVMNVDNNLKLKPAIKLYVESSIQKIYQIQEDVLKKNLQLLFVKYKDQWSFVGSIDLIKKNDYSVFTRDYNIRQIMKKLFTPKDIFLTIRRTLQKENSKNKYLKETVLVDKYEQYIKDSIK